MSSNRHSRHNVLSAAVMTIILMVMAAAVFCNSVSAAAAGDGFCAVGEDETQPEDAANENLTSQEVEAGMLILEDPQEETHYAEYELAVGDTFAITFIHSVNKSPVTDYFEARKDGIYGIKTVYYGFGAGVPTELEEGQTLTYGEDGSMIISGFDVKMKNLVYRVGTVSDHILTLKDGTEISLRELCGRSAAVGFRFEMK